jgi:dienelactone hydrolase
MFEYNARLPLDFQEHTRRIKDGVTHCDVSYVSPGGGRVSAFLLTPPCEGPLAGILFMHPGNTDRRAFLEEAILFSQGGAVALLMDAPYARPPRRPIYSFTSRDHDDFIQAVVDLRRGVDFLVGRADVDPHRIGFVGFSHGAAIGALLAGVEKRIKTYILWGGVAHLTYFLRDFSKSLSASKLGAYLETMAALDPIHHVSHAAPSALLFQNGRLDKSMPETEVDELYQAASDPKQVKWYDAGHALNGQARDDRFEWLRAQLNLASLSSAQMKKLNRFSDISMFRGSILTIIRSRLKSYISSFKTRAV